MLLLFALPTYLFDTSTHGSSRHVLDVATLVQMIIHGCIEEIVSLVEIGRVLFILAPRKPAWGQ
jgi:hypothetical protein